MDALGDNCLIGMGTILLNGSSIGEGSIIAVGSLLTERTVIPPRSMVMGSPAKVVRPVRADELEYIMTNAKEYVEFAEEQLTEVQMYLENYK